ncbi:Acetyltransferase (GNAT) family protein [Agrococcus baldri]|uniref:Acetyltransferase (GNAT) family protein n=1 Tax=Agrococcus baldri TaxID=153730 RepID=A0AA94HNK9_9MICO|nr:GNAT family N-acetyltransferase [Agrococcus baldri]SFS15889.1 Acetyltransferase (GNAT) family protein [Agrococcus baldri]
MTAPDLTWTPILPPADDFDEPALSLIARYVATANRVTQHFWGDNRADSTVEEIVASQRHTEDEIGVRWLVSEAGHDVGRIIAAINREEGASVAYVSAWVVPEARGRGIGRALAERAEHEAMQLGPTSLQAWADHRVPVGGETSIAPKSGHGAIAEDAPARLLASMGYELEQIERVSELDVEAARASLETHRADALTHAGDAYEVRSWQGATPPELLDSMAALHARMATDIPRAGLEVDDERWDAARLQRLEGEWEGAHQTPLQAIALHRGSGEAVAFTILLLPEPGRPAFQEDTLVHAEHRGHRLGMLVKAENLLQLGRLHPDRTRIITWNAEENRPMLRVNEALGFVAIGAEGGWQKRVGAAEPG